MDYSLSWAALANGTLDAACDLLRTDEREEIGRYHLETIGTVPAALSEFRKHLAAEQNAAGGEKAADCICDIPAKLAKALTGFAHDQDTAGMTGDVYQILEALDAVGGSKQSVPTDLPQYSKAKKWRINSRSY